MAKWADYGISKVRYDEEETHIEKVKVRKDQEESFGQEQEKTRNWVVSEIEEGTTFVTIIQSDDNKVVRGQDVHIITVDGKKYIRTDQNRTSKDNLENLPEF